MPKTHIIVIPDSKFDDFRNGLTHCTILKPERTISQGDTVFLENSQQEQYDIIVSEISTPPGLLKGWLLIESDVKIENFGV